MEKRWDFGIFLRVVLNNKVLIPQIHNGETPTQLGGWNFKPHRIHGIHRTGIYTPTWMVDLYGKCRCVYIPVPWILWEPVFLICIHPHETWVPRICQSSFDQQFWEPLEAGIFRKLKIFAPLEQKRNSPSGKHPNDLFNRRERWPQKWWWWWFCKGIPPKIHETFRFRNFYEFAQNYLSEGVFVQLVWRQSYQSLESQGNTLPMPTLPRGNKTWWFNNSLIRTYFQGAGVAFGGCP